MIIYDLNCENGHAFEGWFQSPHDFEAQQQRGLVLCPSCGTADVRRIPSAIHLGKAEKNKSAQAVDQQSSAEQISLNAAPSASPTPSAQDEAVVAMRKLVSMITEKCEDVGNNFAEEARKIHYAEAPERAIRGEVSRDEYRELHDEGIDVFIMPRLKNSNLM